MSDRCLCPACGFPALYDPPWHDGAPSDEICPSCGIHFGYDDADPDAGRRESIYRAWRSKWVADGMRWWSVGGRAAPPEWKPEAQLLSVTDR